MIHLGKYSRFGILISIWKLEDSNYRLVGHYTNTKNVQVYLDFTKKFEDCIESVQSIIKLVESRYNDFHNRKKLNLCRLKSYHWRKIKL